MKQFQFRLDLSSDQYLNYYRGVAQQVLARCPDGLTISFPAHLLKAFVLQDGVHGVFRLTCDDQNRNPTLTKIMG
jgi:Protein of unknown function (DUF2835)